MSTLTETLAAAEAFVDWINAEANIPDGYRYELDPPGRKNVRIVMVAPGSRSVHAFVELASGALLKADGWSRPAKGPRGNILGSGLDAVKARFDWSGGYLYR